MTRYRWVAARKAEGFPITIGLRGGGRQPPGVRRLAGPQPAGPTGRERAEADLVEEIRRVHAEFDGAYGEPRVTAELARRGRVVNHKRVERLMRAHGIVGVHKAARVRTTIPAEDAPPLPDLIGRRFAPGRPDVAWVGDITYIPTGQGWLYLASVLDLGSRRLLGYSMADHMRTEPRGRRAAHGRRRPGRRHRAGSSSTATAAANTSPATTAVSSAVSAWSSRSAAPACAGTTAWPSRSGRRSNGSSCTATASPTGPPPAGRSSPGSTATTSAGSTRASATYHPLEWEQQYRQPPPAA